jgi:hypothetical protein
VSPQRQERESDLVTTAGRLLRDVSRLPRLWVVCITLLAFFSTLDVTRTTAGEVSVHFHVTAVTAAILALAWLPAIVRAIVLTGGGVKTPAGEANTGGLLSLLRQLSPDVKREVLPSLAAALDSVEISVASDAERAEARTARSDVERELQHAILPVGVPDGILDQHANDYEAIRAEMPPGSERTFRMGSLMSEVRAVAGFVEVTERSVTHRYESGRDGDRVVALTLLEAHPLSDCLDVVLDGIANSRSAFEQFQALRAAEELLPELSEPDQHRLGEVLAEEYADHKGKGLREDPSREYPIRQMLAQIEGFGTMGFGLGPDDPRPPQ